MLGPGDRVGDYELEEVLGHGAMGAVFRARHVLIGRTVAVKVLLPHLAADPDLRERFRREARALAAIEHPSIVPIYDAREVDDQTLIIAMRLLPGGTLGDRTARGALAPEYVVRIADEIGGALDCLHEQGLVHRDVKPSNVLFDEHGRAVLGDFGIARDPREATLTGTAQVLGTLRYMSPERLRSEEPDARTDVYAFSAVLHEALSGVPFALGPAGEVPSLALADPELSRRFDEVLKAGLAADPQERTGSAGAVAAGLAAALREPSAAEDPAEATLVAGPAADDPAAPTVVATPGPGAEPAEATAVDARPRSPGAAAPPADPAGPAERRPRRAWWWALGAAVVLIGAGAVAAVLIASGGSDTGSTAATKAPQTSRRQATGPPPADTAVRIGMASVPVTTYEHWRRIARRSTEGKPPTAAKLKDQVMTFLIRAQWLEAEATRRGITVTPAEVRASLAKARRQAFPKAADYARFLRESGQTEEDLLFRQRSQVLEEKITKEVTGGKTGAAARSALTRYGAAYQRRWRAKTWCGAGYLVKDCSNFDAGRAASASSLKKKPVCPTRRGTAPTRLVTEDLIVGTGAKARLGDELTMKYVGWLYDTCKEFDSSWKRNDTFPLTLGAGQVIAGWDNGLAGMRVGGRRLLIIPPDQAYGETGQPPTIPANATLVFAVDLVRVQKGGSGG